MTVPRLATALSATFAPENVDVSPASLGGAAISACRDTGTMAPTAVRVGSRHEFAVHVVPNLIVTFRYVEAVELAMLQRGPSRLCLRRGFVHLHPL